MNVLCVVPSVPLPTNTGGTLRTLHLLKALDARFNVTVLAPHKEDADEAALRKMIRGELVVVRRPLGRAERMAKSAAWALRGKPLSYEAYACDEMVAALEELLASRQFDAVHFDHIHTAQLLPVIRRRQPGARIVIDEHNVEAQVVERVARLSSWPIRPVLRWQARRVDALESALLSAADMVLACSSRDKGLLQWRGARNVKVISNGVDVQSMKLSPDAERTDVIFVGSMDWWPNSDAALRLVKDIWPVAVPSLGATRLAIVGRNPPAQVRALESDRVIVTGTVDSVKPYLSRAWATAIPLRAGSGTRLKILEAAAARVPVVATRLAAEGLPVVDGEHVLFAETPREFEQALTRLWTDRALAQRIADSAFALVQEFDWARIGEELASVYRAWAPRGRVPAMSKVDREAQRPVAS